MTKNSKPLADRVALVTGGGSGIGRAIASALAGAGAAVAVAGRRSEPLEEWVEEIRQVGGRGLAVVGDVSRPQEAQRLVEEVVSEYGGLQILVNNAGIARGGPIEEMSSEDIEAVIDIDLKGPIWMLRAALPELSRKQASGVSSVINISSSVTLNPVPNFSVYSAAKAGLDMLTRCLARDWASRGIRVNAINPGVVNTPIFSTMMPSEQIAGMLREIGQQTPLSRIGEPADVARLALFLAGPQSEWMTGAVVPLDGGLSLAS